MAKPFANTFIFRYIIKTKIYLCCDRLGGKVLCEFSCQLFETPEPDFVLLALHQSLNTKCHQMHLLRVVQDPWFGKLQVDCYLLVVCCHFWMVLVLYQWSFILFTSSYNRPLAVITKECFVFKEKKTRHINFVNESSFLVVCSAITFCQMSVNCIIVSYRHIVVF